ncbi:MAG: hypothetical protein JF627_00360 [Alphaproteobacteria bacterium]|nr:hypothetical protein [Alphaproteobacteria bacterium]
MAEKRKGTLAKAEATFLKAMRNFQETVMGMVGEPEPAPKAKKAAKRKRKTKKRTSKRGRR